MEQRLEQLYTGLERSIYKIDNYLGFYSRMLVGLTDRPITLVEIGVYGGGSLELWKKFLHPESRVIGIDLNPTAETFVPKDCEFFSFDQEDADSWLNFFENIGEVDVVIDDGGHLDGQQIRTIQSVVPNLRPGGKLFIEDLFFSYRKSQGNPSNRSCISYLKRLIDDLNIRYKEFQTEPTEPVSKYISEICFGTAIACITTSSTHYSYAPRIIESDQLAKIDYRNYQTLKPAARRMKKLQNLTNRILRYAFLRNNLVVNRANAIVSEKLRRWK